MRRRSLLASAVPIVAATAGCMGLLDDSYDVEYGFRNDDETAFDLRLFVLDEDAEVEVTWVERSPWTRTVHGLHELLQHDPDRITGIDPVDEAIDEQTFDLEPGDEVADRLESVPGDAVVLAVVARADGDPPVQAFGSFMCPDLPLRRMEVQLLPGGRWNSSGGCEA